MCETVRETEREQYGTGGNRWHNRRVKSTKEPTIVTHRYRASKTLGLYVCFRMAFIYRR